MIKLAATHYWRQLGLMTDPFPLGAPVGLHYTDRQLQYLDFLLNTEQYRKALLLVVGEPGVGKTTLINRAYQALQNKTKILKIEATPALHPESLLTFLANALHALPSQNQNNLEIAAETFLDRLQTTDLNYLLIIDNADLLPTKTQELCLYLVKYQVITQTCLQLILVGNLMLQQQFAKILKIQATALDDYLIQILSIQPFNQIEVEQYLKNQLKLAGDRGQITFFSLRDIEKIYHASRGRPMGIQAVARTLLQKLVQPKKEPPTYLEAKEPRPPSKIKRRVLVSFLFLSLFLWAITRFLPLWTNPFFARFPVTNPRSSMVLTKQAPVEVTIKEEAPAQTTPPYAAGSHLIVNGEMTTTVDKPASPIVPETISVPEAPSPLPIAPLPSKKILTKIKTEDLVPRKTSLSNSTPTPSHSLAEREKIIINGEIQELPVLLGQSSEKTVAPSSNTTLSNAPLENPK
jgi:type II secretory pathway predicted ATPase ExeA